MLNSLYQSFSEAIRTSFPIILISIFLFSLIRFIYLKKTNKEIIIYKEISLIVFELYFVCLFQIVMNQDINMLTGNNFIPFREISRYKPFDRLFIKNIIGNIVLFIPLGVFYGRLVKGRKYFLPLIIIFLFSFSIEIIQYLIGRIFDIDDIILNVFGGLLGFIIYLIGRVVYHYIPLCFKTDKVKNITAYLVFVFVMFVIINILV